ncbi:MAG: 23S rRNA (adenine(2030)-N(6))-methyltransferase RlmJ [Rhodospirillaceae bacterium]
MNYRHIFHAGNFADVVKHSVLALILDYLMRKPAPLAILDIHAGIGCYDLESEQARRTGEAAGGIGRVIAASGDDGASVLPAGYLAAIAALNGGQLAAPLRRYPGSPRIARTLLRPGDRLILTELHPDDAVTLRREFAGDSQVAVHRMDGYLALKAHLPPLERRGLVLIDPPYESADETARVIDGLRLAWRRWSTGVYLIWYPIKERAAVWRLHEALAATGITRILTTELTLYPEDDPSRLNGCGLAIVNPPYELPAALDRLLPRMHHAFGSGAGTTRTEWLVPEATVTREGS